MENNKRQRRIKNVAVGDQLFTDVLTKGKALLVKEGLPKGAVLLGVSRDILRRQWLVSFEHPSFQIHEEGTYIHTENEQSVVYVDISREYNA